MKQSRTVPTIPRVESPRHLPLVDLLVDARSELFELAVRSGLKVLETMLKEDRNAVCGPRYAHVAERLASRAGTVRSEVVFGGRKVAVRRPRVRASGREVPLPTFQAMADVDRLNRRVVEQMLVGVATRRYARSLEPVPATMRSRGTSKSAVSRRVVAKTTAQLAAWQTASLEGLDLVGLLIDRVHIGDAALRWHSESDPDGVRELQAIERHLASVDAMVDHAGRALDELAETVGAASAPAVQRM